MGIYCTGCGNEMGSGQKFCTACGKPFQTIEMSNNENLSLFTRFGYLFSWKYLRGYLFIGLLIWGLYASLDDTAIELNNNAIENADSGNTEEAIRNFQQASQDAYTDETKLLALINLGITQASDLKEEDALATFRQALTISEKDSFEFYFVSAEIAYLEGKASSAFQNYSKALSIRPEDYQINTSLAIFYLDMDGLAPQYENYKKSLQYAEKAYNIRADETARQNLGIAHYFNENFSQAISFLSKTNLSQHPYVAIWLGLAYVGAEDYANGKYFLRQAINSGITLSPDIQEIYDSLP